MNFLLFQLFYNWNEWHTGAWFYESWCISGFFCVVLPHRNDIIIIILQVSPVFFVFLKKIILRFFLCLTYFRFLCFRAYVKGHFWPLIFNDQNVGASLSKVIIWNIFFKWLNACFSISKLAWQMEHSRLSEEPWRFTLKPHALLWHVMHQIRS